jgi:hypothetical protein
VDLLDIKGRIAVALVESIFRRAGFALAGLPPGMTPSRQGREELAPDFAATRPPDPGPPVPRRPVEVRYRVQVGQYLSIEEQRGGQSVFALAKRQWPDLLFVLVTEHPEPGRSSFQAFDLAGWDPGRTVASIDLFAHDQLAIYPQNVEEHEVLLRRMFALLTGGR